LIRAALAKKDAPMQARGGAARARLRVGVLVALTSACGAVALQ
jgi:hypothetical protein